MRIKPLLLSAILMASCVSQSEYDELKDKYDALMSDYEECQQERNECRQLYIESRQLYLEKCEEVEELEYKIAHMQDAMREAVSYYDFWGPGHFFTRSSVHELSRFY